MANKNLRIKDIAKDKGLTLEQVANKIGIRRTSLSQALTRSSFSLDKLAEIADALEVTIPELFEDYQPTSMYCPHCGHPIKVILC